MLRSNLVKVLAVAAFCSLPYSLVANVGTANAAGINMEDTIATTMKLVDSGNSSYFEHTNSNFQTIHYNYAVYSGDNNSALIAITAEGPENSQWFEEDFTLSALNDPFANVLPNDNWKSERITKISGNQATIYEYREIDNGQARSDMGNNAKAAIQKVEAPFAMKTKPAGHELSATALQEYLPGLKMHNYAS